MFPSSLNECQRKFPRSQTSKLGDCFRKSFLCGQKRFPLLKSWHCTHLQIQITYDFIFPMCLGAISKLLPYFYLDNHKFYTVFSTLSYINYISFLKGQQIVTYTSIVEIFATQYRTFTSLSVGYFWAAGIMTLALLSFLIKDWHYIQLLSTTVCLYQIGLVWWVQTS